MNKKIPMAVALVAAQLAAFHVSQPSDCNCSDRYVGPMPADLPQQPENLPEAPQLLVERDSAGSSSTVVSAILSVATENLAHVSAWNTISVG